MEPQIKEVEIHRTKLKDLCRTCGNRIKISKNKNPKLVIFYEETIKNIFNVDILQDEDDIHPKNVCETCRKRLDHCHKNQGPMTSARPLITFEEHQENNCIVCQPKKVGKPGKEKLPTLSLQSNENQKQEDKNIFSKKNLQEKCKLYELTDLTSNLNLEVDEFCVAKLVTNYDSIPTITISSIIKLDGTWSLFVFGKKINSITTLPQQLSLSSIDQLFVLIKKSNLCIGNNDFPDIIAKKYPEFSSSRFLDKSGEEVAVVESPEFHNAASLTTIRHVNCQILVQQPGLRCEICDSYRKTLNTISWRNKKTSDDIQVHKNTRNTFLSREELIEKTQKLNKDKYNLKRSISNYENYVAKLIKEEGEVVSDNLHDICSSTMLSNKEVFDEGSPQSLLWEQQKKQASLANAKSMKWHPTMIRWCLSIYLKSPGAYDYLRQSGFLCLPHKKTILNYANFTDPKCGINIDVLKKLNQTTLKFKDMERFVGLVFDEMKIKSGLLYSRHNGKIVGFTDMGDINNELQEFKNRIENETHPPIASHILTFMVRGVCTSLKFPLAYFAGQGFSSDQLFTCVWQCVRALEGMNLKVVFFTSDGASPNRRFYKLHLDNNSSNISTDGVVYWCYNKYAAYGSEKRKIYFICDVPHLIKTTRNNFENSNFHNKTRNLMVNGYKISWDQIISLLEYDMGKNEETPGLRQTKLSTDHVYLTPPMRMNVSLAAQVLSNSVAVGLKNQGRHDTVETCRFVSMFDKFFDCLNVKSFLEGRHKRKENLMPYSSVTDERLKWLKEDFLGYLNSWQRESQQIPDLTKDERNKLCLSIQTLEGLRITVNSFIEIVPFMLQSGASYVLSDKFNQDPLEEHFGKHRMKGGSRENPTVQDYQYTELKLQAGAGQSFRILRGNTRGRNENPRNDMLDDSPLMKRQKK